MGVAITDDDELFIEDRCHPVVEVFPLRAAHRRDQQDILAMRGLGERPCQRHQLDGERFFEASGGLFHDLDGDTAWFAVRGANDIGGQLGRHQHNSLGTGVHQQ